MAKSEGTLDWGRSTVETACPLDCPDSCSLAVTVEKGEVVTIDGSARQPTTKGYICAKVRRFGDRVYGEARLQHPAVRNGPRGSGEFKRVTWDEALDLIATRMTEIRRHHGAEAILPFSYGGSNGLLSQDTADAELFRGFGTSRLARTVCAAATGAALDGLYGKMAGVGYSHYPDAKLIVVWGANPSTTGIHLVPYIQDAQKAGATLVVIDPRRTPLARRADLHLAVRPGTDLAVALAVHAYLFEQGLADEAFLAAHTRGSQALRERAKAWPLARAAEVAGLEASQLETFTRLYGETSPAVIRCGWGLERNRNGGSAAAAILALPAVAGKFGVRGGGYTMSNSSAWKIDPTAWRDAEEPATRVINMNRLGRTLLEGGEPPIKMLFIYNCNPVATMPDQNRVLRGLQREDLFTVVFDQVMTDTAEFADVILPATTFLESYDVAKGYGSLSLQIVQPVIEAVGEARPNVQVFREIAARLGISVKGDPETDAEALLQVLQGLPEEARQQLVAGASAEPPYGPSPVQFVDVYPQTPDAKVDLCPERLDQEAPAGLYGYQTDPGDDVHPLALISPASDKTISSSLGELRKLPAILEMHPDDARARGVENEDAVRIFNERGQMECEVSVTDAVRRGTVTAPKGLWRQDTANGSTTNALAPDTLTDLGAGACFNDTRVQVVKIVRTEWERQEVSFTIGAVRGANSATVVH